MNNIEIIKDWRKDNKIFMNVLEYAGVILTVLLILITIILIGVGIYFRSVLFIILIGIPSIFGIYVAIGTTYIDIKIREYNLDYRIIIRAEKTEFINLLNQKKFIKLMEHKEMKSWLSTFSDIYWYTYYGDTFYVLITNSRFSTIRIHVPESLRQNRSFLFNVLELM